MSLSPEIHVTLPDGSTKTVPAGTTPLDVAKGISPRLADAAIVARVNGDLFDLTRPFEGDASLQLLTSKDPDALYVYRHSTAHLLAAAVLDLVVCEALYLKFPQYQEGDLTKVKSAVVSRRTCAEVAMETGLHDLLIIGKGLSSRSAMPWNSSSRRASTDGAYARTLK